SLPGSPQKPKDPSLPPFILPRLSLPNCKRFSAISPFFLPPFFSLPLFSPFHILRPPFFLFLFSDDTSILHSFYDLNFNFQFLIFNFIKFSSIFFFLLLLLLSLSFFLSFLLSFPSFLPSFLPSSLPSFLNSEEK